MELIFRVHAIQRMFQRNISEVEVSQVLDNGKTIETYPNDEPYPSRLILGWIAERPIHVVVADDKENERIIIVTVYEPDSIQWEEGFERRKQKK